MQNWLTLSLITMLLWGSWSVLSKLGTGRMSTLGAKVWETIGFTLATIPILIYLGFRVVWDEQGFLYSVLGGLTGGLGNYFYFRAFSQGGKAVVVTALVSTYPVLTILLAWSVLNESITLTQTLGCACAIGAATLMAE